MRLLYLLDVKMMSLMLTMKMRKVIVKKARKVTMMMMMMMTVMTIRMMTQLVAVVLMMRLLANQQLQVHLHIHCTKYAHFLMPTHTVRTQYTSDLIIHHVTFITHLDHNGLNNGSMMLLHHPLRYSFERWFCVSDIKISNIS